MAEENPSTQRQTAVTAYFKNKTVPVVCLCTAVSMPVLDGRRESCPTKTCSSKKEVTVVFVFAWRSVFQYSMAGENPGAQR